MNSKDFLFLNKKTSIVLGLLAGIVLAALLNLYSYFSVNVPITNISTDYGIAFFWAIGIALLIFLFPYNRVITRHLVFLWIARCMVTLGFMLYYEQFYKLDAYTYYQKGITGSFFFDQDEFSGGSYLISYFVWLMNEYLPIFESYHSIKVIFSFFGFLGVYYFYSAYTLHTKKHNVKLLYFLGLFPSIIFWSSILGKDPICFLGIGLVFFSIVGLFREYKFKYILFLIIGLAMASMIRIWLIYILTIPVIYVVFSAGIKKGYIARTIFLSLIVAGSLFYFESKMEYFKFENSKELLDHTQTISRGWAAGGSGMKAPDFRTTGDLIRFAPIGMFTALFRPLPGEVMNIFGLFAGIENLFLIIYFVWYGIFRMNSEVRNKPIFKYSISLLIFWAFLYGFVSYQNLGTASRFKLQVLPLLILIPHLVSFYNDRIKNNSHSLNS